MIKPDGRKLFIRTDATSTTGTGHMMRCFALAQAWQCRGGEVVFVSRCESDLIRNRIINEGFKFIPIKQNYPDSDDLCTVTSLKKEYKIKGSEVLLVLDGYYFDQAYHVALRKNGFRLLVIDDTHHLPYYHADIILNQNINAEKTAYMCDPDTVVLLGLKYVLMRSEFLKNKRPECKVPDVAKKVLVTMGGSDHNNVTFNVLKGLQLVNILGLEVKTVVGPSNLYVSALKEEIRKLSFTNSILVNVQNMYKLMTWADVAITAAGSTCWELAFMGVPALVVITADNQLKVADGLDRAGLFKSLGWCDKIDPAVLAKETVSLMLDKDLRKKKINIGQQLVDGQGVERLVDIICGSLVPQN
jgi:UDP-2,4-diacetamido-2,4,6-trideoxy-beta-L-altropyranose hydrolase